MPGNHIEIEKHLWDAADELRANSKSRIARLRTRTTSTFTLLKVVEMLGKEV